MSFTWSRTRPDLHYDFVARDPDGCLVGRIRRDVNAQGKTVWMFAANGVRASAGAVGVALNGYVDTRDEAIERLHVAWQAWMAMGGAVHRVV